MQWYPSIPPALRRRFLVWARHCSCSARKLRTYAREGSYAYDSGDLESGWAVGGSSAAALSGDPRSHTDGKLRSFGDFLIDYGDWLREMEVRR